LEISRTNKRIGVTDLLCPVLLLTLPARTNRDFFEGWKGCCGFRQAVHFADRVASFSMYCAGRTRRIDILSLSLTVVLSGIQGLNLGYKVSFKITSALHEYFRYTDASTEVERRGFGSSRPELAWANRQKQQEFSDISTGRTKSAQSDSTEHRSSNSSTVHGFLDSGGSAMIAT
jgi:hypothetical protein